MHAQFKSEAFTFLNTDETNKKVSHAHSQSQPV